MAEAPRIAIIGTGAAGVAAAKALRKRGHDGAIVLIGAESCPPYERPPLSKATIAEGADPPTLLDETKRTELDIDLRLDTEIAAIDRDRQRLRLAAGDDIPYDRLLLATGAIPRRLPVPGGETCRLLRLRADSEGIRATLHDGAHVAIIGGGLIGLELAASATRLGVRVTVIEAAPRILGRAVPAPLAEAIERRHLDAGIEILTGAKITHVEDGRVVHVDGRTPIEAEVVIAGIGIDPATALAEAAGLDLDNGIATNALHQTSDNAIFAAGDCASIPHALYDDARIRLECWTTAGDAGTSAAAAMLGDSEPFRAVPWFWSDQYDETLQVAGLPDFATETIERDVGTAAPMLFHLARDGRLLAASAFGPVSAYAKHMAVAERLIGANGHPDPSVLADSQANLKSLLRAAKSA